MRRPRLPDAQAVEDTVLFLAAVPLIAAVALALAWRYNRRLRR